MKGGFVTLMVNTNIVQENTNSVIITTNSVQEKYRFTPTLAYIGAQSAHVQLHSV
jgi:hypothetical protein